MSHGVYLSYPIDQHGERPWELERVRKWLKQHDCVSWIYSPGDGFSVGMAGRTSGIREINLFALGQASVVVAFLPAGAATIGVPMEIQRGLDSGKSVLVVSDAPSWMLEDPNLFVISQWRDSMASSWLHERLETPTGATGGGLPQTTNTARAPMPVVVSQAGEEPRRGYHDDAGLDLFVSTGTTLLPGEFTDVPCDVRVELPEWSWGMITGRSSTLRQRGLLVNQGVVDAGYRGPLFAGAWNLTDEPVFVAKGERIAQLLILHNGTRLVEPVVVEELSPGSRGENGFGSTGT